MNNSTLMNALYPLKFKPVFKEKIWGGLKIKTQLNLDFSPLPNCGEAWVLSGVQGSETVVSNGFLAGNTINELLEVYMDDLVGEKVFDVFGEEFPLLLKFIDSNDYLSVQVHPDDTLALNKGLGNGKTEMWYIIQSDSNASLYAGFNKDIDQKTYQDQLNNNMLKEVLNDQKASPGDVFFIPAGMIHALGPGILLAEIQQSSDTTYRIDDWGRTDDKGNPRELHPKEALEALNFSLKDSRIPYSPELNKTTQLIDDSHFKVNHLEFDHPLMKDYSLVDSFIIYLCIEGGARISTNETSTEIKKGECVLIPAAMESVKLFPDKKCKLLEVFIG